MKAFVLLLNVLLLALTGYFLLEYGVPERNADFIYLAMLTPVATLILFAMEHRGYEGIIGLYLRRKILEEKQRIAELEKSGKQ